MLYHNTDGLAEHLQGGNIDLVSPLSLIPVSEFARTSENKRSQM